MALKIKSIKKIGIQKTVDIEVKNTHSYQLENGAVSHNSVLLQTASGIHAEHAPRYLRNVQLNKDNEVAKLLKRKNPYMVEDSVWSEGGTDYVVSFPIISPDVSVYKEELYGTALLEKVKLVQQNWVECGTNKDLCVDPTVRHNVSNTVTVKDNKWDEVAEYLYDNRNFFAGVSFLSASGDKDYAQAPFVEVLTEKQIVEKYGLASLFASGLVVDSHKGFNDLWEAISIARNGDKDRGELSDLRHDWIRRFKKFSANYFDGDDKQTEYCLKDVALLHKWTKIQQNFESIDFVAELEERTYTDIDTMSGAACSSGVCEIDF